MQVWQAQLQRLVEFATDPIGFFALGVMVLFIIFAIIKPTVRMMAVTLLLWSTLLTKPVNMAALYSIPDLIAPLELLRGFSRALTAISAIVLVLPSATSNSGLRGNRFSAAMWALLIFHMIVCVMQIVSGGDVTKALLSLVVICSVFFVFSRGLGTWLQDMDDVHRILNAVAWVAVIFIGTTTIQGLINSSAIKWNGRLHATTANPQFAAAAMALLFPTVAYLALHKATPKLFRFMYFGLLGLFVVFLGWTGSRTGMLMSAVGLTLLFRLRLGKALIAVIGASGVFFIGYMIFGSEAEATDRMFTMKDTRSGVWRSMFGSFQSNPLLGAAGRDYEGFTGSENSYLLTAASFGLIGLVPLLVAAGLVLREVIWLLTHRSQLRAISPTAAMLADLSAATLMAIGAGSLFEGYLMSQFAFAVYMAFIFLAISLYLRDYVKRETADLYTVTKYDSPDPQHAHYPSGQPMYGSPMQPQTGQPMGHAMGQPVGQPMMRHEFRQ